MEPNLDLPVKLSYKTIVEKTPKQAQEERVNEFNGYLRSKKSLEEEAYDQNWDSAWGFPHIKIQKDFYFGGMKKGLKIPLSTPNRAIVEPNPPRQGYSYLTWHGLNEYILQKCLDRDEYNWVLNKFRQIAF